MERSSSSAQALKLLVTSVLSWLSVFDSPPTLNYTPMAGSTQHCPAAATTQGQPDTSESQSVPIAEVPIQLKSRLGFEVEFFGTPSE